MNERLKEVRKALKLTQKDFGKAMNMSANYIYMLESGQKEISQRFLFVLGEVFNVSREWMRTGEGEMFYEINVQDVLEELHIEKVSTSEEAYERLMHIVHLYYQMTKEQQELYVKLAKTLAEDTEEETR